MFERIAGLFGYVQRVTVDWEKVDKIGRDYYRCIVIAGRPDNFADTCFPVYQHGVKDLRFRRNQSFDDGHIIVKLFSSSGMHLMDVDVTKKRYVKVKK